jgi:hypothetical protein
MQCGVTCLRMICGYHGREIPNYLLESVCVPTAFDFPEQNLIMKTVLKKH